MTPAADAQLALDALCTRIPAWRDSSALTLTPLSGGITNHNYRVDKGGKSYVLRLPGVDTALLGIDRAVEVAATRAAAAIGLAPEVVAFLEPQGYLVTRWVDGRALAPEEIREPPVLRAVGEALARLHRLAPLRAPFSPFQVVRAYDRFAHARGAAAFPENYPELLAGLSRVERALAARPVRAAPCHNDLLTANFLLGTRGLVLIDWEYAGQGDPLFDLANVAAHHDFDEAQLELLLASYVNAAPDAHQRARVRLLRIASDFREAMWGVLQQAISQLDFDFSSHAARYFSRVAAGLSHPTLERWLAAL